MEILAKPKTSCLPEIDRRFVGCPAHSLLHTFNWASLAYLIICINIYLIKHGKDVSSTATGLPANQYRHLTLPLGTHLHTTLWVLTFCPSLEASATAVSQHPSCLYRRRVDSIRASHSGGPELQILSRKSVIPPDSFIGVLSPPPHVNARKSPQNGAWWLVTAS
jgi:hypothetical protein